MSWLTESEERRRGQQREFKKRLDEFLLYYRVVAKECSPFIRIWKNLQIDEILVDLHEAFFDPNTVSLYDKTLTITDPDGEIPITIRRYENNWLIPNRINENFLRTLHLGASMYKIPEIERTRLADALHEGFVQMQVTKKIKKTPQEFNFGFSRLERKIGAKWDLTEPWVPAFKTRAFAVEKIFSYDDFITISLTHDQNLVVKLGSSSGPGITQTTQFALSELEGVKALKKNLDHFLAEQFVH